MPTERPTVPSHAAPAPVATDACSLLRPASQYQAVNPLLPCRPADLCASIARSAAIPVQLNGDPVHRIRSALSRAILAALSGGWGRPAEK